MRRLLLSLALALALSAVGASSALAEAPQGAQKAPLYGPNALTNGFSCEGGVFRTPERFGFVVFNTAGNGRELEVSGEVSLKRAATATYEVGVVQDTGGQVSCIVTPAGTLTTNNQGNGNLHVLVARYPGVTKFWVELGQVFGTETYGSSAVELD